MFTDNCIGKGNFKYFFSFIFWADITLIFALSNFIVKFYTVNVEEKYGAQSLSHAMSNLPQHDLLLTPFGYGEFKWTPVTTDGMLLTSMIMLIAIVSYPGYGTMSNIFYRTSEVLKLKAEKNDIKEDDLQTEKPMTVEEVLDFIYGKDRTIT